MLYSLNKWPLRLVRLDTSEQLQLIMNVESVIQAVSLWMKEKSVHAAAPFIKQVKVCEI